MLGNSNDETNFSHELLSTNRQFSRLCKAFANGSSVNITFSKTQWSTMIQSGEAICDIPIFGSILSDVAKFGVELK